MKKKIELMLLCATVVMLSSCASSRLTGTYPSTNHFAETKNSFETVWSRIIDYFAIEGIPISVVDKSSGLIVASKTSFLNSYTREVKGKPLNPGAYVVIPTIKGGFGNVLEPNAKIKAGLSWEMLGDWNVRVKETDGNTIVNVNLINLVCFYIDQHGKKTVVPIESTGKFEKGLLDYLTRE